MISNYYFNKMITTLTVSKVVATLYTMISVLMMTVCIITFILDTTAVCMVPPQYMRMCEFLLRNARSINVGVGVGGGGWNNSNFTRPL